MKAFQRYLMGFVIFLGTYTVIVGANHGWNLLQLFFADIFAMTWAGQFNSDFTGFLSLSGLWLAWRNQFSTGGIVLGVLGFFGGMMVLAPYLILMSRRADGDMAVVLLGAERAAALRR